MQAVVLAAGRGKRLQPITLTRSKAMVPVAGKPIVERVMDDLIANGLSDFVLVISPDDEEIQRYFGDGAVLGVKIQFAHQTERLGMAHALACAAPCIYGDFFLAACDNLVSAEHVGRMVAAWNTKPRPSGVLTLMPVEPERLGAVGIVETDGRWVRRIVEKPTPEEAPSNISSVPLYAFSRRILEYLPEVPLSARGEYELQDAIQMLIERDGGVCGVTIARRRTVTTPDDLLALNRHYLDREASRVVLAPKGVEGDIRLIPPLHIEPGAVIGPGCTIGPYVVMEEGCRVGKNAVLKEAIVLRGAVVPEGATVNGQVVA